MDTPAAFETHVETIRLQYDLNCFLTGFAGGVRYAPVVRYNKVHIILRQAELKTFMKAAQCKAVDSGANVHIHVINNEVYFHDARVVNGYHIVSPVQIYLDCMKLSGRCEEMALAILRNEIEK